MADELLQEIAPLLAQEGIELGGSKVYDLDTLQAAFGRAVERRNMELDTPVGPARNSALATVRSVVAANDHGSTADAATFLDTLQPMEDDPTRATVSGCIGAAVGLLDTWLSGHAPAAPVGLGGQVRLPPGRWNGERAATDLLALAGKGKAFRSLTTVIARQRGEYVLYGSALALTATVQALARTSGRSVEDVLTEVLA